MLVLATFRKLLSQVLSEEDGIHTAVLSTPSGNLVSFSSLNPVQRNKSEIRMIVGLSLEIWNETVNSEEPKEEDDDIGMAECELGRLLVQPVYGKRIRSQDDKGSNNPAFPDDEKPLVLLSINAKDSADWDSIAVRATSLAKQLSVPLGQHGNKLFKDPPLQPPTRQHERSGRLPR